MTELFFIDYRDDSPQNTSVQKQKRNFAQRNYQRKKRLAAIERLKTSTFVLRQRLPLPYKPATRPSDPDRTESGRAEKSKQDASESGAAPTGTDTPLTPVVDFGSPKTLLGQGFVDPLFTNIFPMTGLMNSYFHQLRNFTIPGAYPLDKSRMSVWWWQQGLSQPVIQLALLVSAAGHQTAMHALNNAPSKYSQQSVREFLRLRGDMIKMLNGLLLNPALAKSTVLIVGSLRAIEAIEGNVEAATAHTKGLEVLIQLNGGLDALDHMIVSKIYHGDILTAALTNKPPALPLIASWRSEILQETKIIHSTGNLISQLSNKIKIASQLSLLGTSFFASPWYQDLEESMKNFLHISQHLIQYYEIARLQPSIVMPTDNDLFVLLEYQLISTRYTPLPHASCTVSSLLNKLLHITLFIYLNIRVWHFQVFPIMQYLVNDLQKSLLPTTPIPLLVHVKKTAPDLLFWILFIGGMASKGHEGHEWFIVQLTELTLYLEIHDWEEARSILGGFFYTDQPGQRGGEELWEQVVSAQARARATDDIRYS